MMIFLSKKRLIWPLLIFGVAIFIRVAYLALLGVHIGADSSLYTTYAQLITNARYNIFTFASHGVPPYYWFYPLIIALFHDQQLAIALFQIFLQGIAAILIYNIGAMVFDMRAGIIAGFLYGGFFELFQWDSYILTDSLFVFLLVLATYLLFRWERVRSWLSAVLVLGVFLCIIMLRPTSLPFFGAVVIWAMTIFRSNRRLLIGIGLMFLGILLLLSVRLGLFNPQHHLGISYYSGYFSYLFRHGIVIRDRPEYTIPVHWDKGVTLSNILLLVVIFLRRLLAFWYITVREFAPPHKLLNIVTLPPLYILGIWGFIRARSKSSLNIFTIFLFQVIVFFWVFQALTEVDYDFRYRIPVLPFVVLFAGNGLASLLPQNVTNKESLYELGRYILAGFMVAATDFGLLNLFIRVFHVNLYISILIGFLFGSLFGYIIHSRWTFRYDARGRHIMKLSQLIMVGVGGIVLTEAVIYSFVHMFHIYYNLAKLVAVGVSFLWAYSCSRWWVFRKS